jgi:hypothetical protein
MDTSSKEFLSKAKNKNSLKGSILFNLQTQRQLVPFFILFTATFNILIINYGIGHLS